MAFALRSRGLESQASLISAEHAEAAAALPLHHRDPFDRMLVAQAQMESLILVTADDTIGRYDVDLLDARR